jgi:hypothetical protein
VKDPWRVGLYCLVNINLTKSLSWKDSVSPRTATLRGGYKLTVNTSITITVRLADHLIDLIIGELFTHRFHDMAELSSRNKTVAITIENLTKSCLDMLGLARRYVIEP